MNSGQEQNKLIDAERQLIDAVFNLARLELKHKPEAYFDYEIGKELRVLRDF